MPNIPVKQIGQGGMITDIPEYALPPNNISNAFNIRYDNGAPARCKGWKAVVIDISSFTGYKFLDGIESINNAQNVIVFALSSVDPLLYKVPQPDKRKDTFASLLSTGTLKLVYYDGVTPIPTDISPVNYPIVNYQTLNWSAIYGAVILNTQVGVPYIYAELDNNFRPLERWVESLGADATCQIFTNFKNFYVALNMKEDGKMLGNKIRWSGIIEPPITAGYQEILTVTASAATSLNTKKFILYVGRDYPLPPLAPERTAQALTFVYNTTVTPTNPPAGTIEIMVASGASAATVASLTVTAINNAGYHTASANSATITITNKNTGPNKAPIFSLDATYVGWTPTFPKQGQWGNDPTWDETDLNALAGFMFLPDDNDFIVAAEKLSDKLMIYTLKSTYAMTFVGGSYVFSIAKVFMDDGCASQFGVQEFDGKHLVVGRSDVFIHDGNSKKSIVAGRIKEYFYSSIKSLELIKTFKNAKTQDIFIYYSHEPEAIRDKAYDRAWVYNYRDDVWSIVELPSVETIISGPSISFTNSSYNASTDSWDTVSDTKWSDYATSEITPRFYYISYWNNKVYLGDEGGQRDNADYPAYISRGHIDMDELFKSNYPIKYIKQILPSVEGEGIITFEFSISKSPQGAENSTAIINSISLGENDFNLSTEQYKIDTQLSGRYFKYTIRMNTKGSFKMHELEFNLEPRGMR
ncbi:MAG: hypothetical protein ACHQ1D_01725 [Nitrososphaerales archaeon]